MVVMLPIRRRTPALLTIDFHFVVFTPMRMKRVLCAALLFLTSPAWSQSLTVEEDDPPEMEPQLNWLPFAFFSESFGLGLGVGGAVSHIPDPESSLLGAVTMGTTGSYNIAFGGSQLRIPGLDRLFFYPMAVVARYQNQDLFVGTQNPGFEGQRAGAHNSDPDNFFEATQWDNWAKLEMRYLLPIGHGRSAPVINRYVVDQGILKRGATGGDAFNPWTSGRSYFVLTPGWRKQTLDNEDLNVPVETLNVKAGFRWDNRDYPFNPSRGENFEVTYQKDFTDTDDLGGWEAWFLQAEKVFDFGKGDLAGQRVLAFDLWTSYVPSWETDAEGNVTRRPPQNEGATLGGFYRMRGYESHRFQDKAAITYTVEMRVIPEWQPLVELRALDWAKLRYWQWVVFAEAGRVADSWNLDTLHDDMNFDAGFSLRGMFYQAVCRLDVAFSEEGSRIVAMYGQPF